MTDLESVCPNCGKTFAVYRDGIRLDRKYCSKACWRDFVAKKKAAKEKLAAETRGKIKPLSQTLVSQERCKKCRYHMKYGYLYHCGYVFCEGRTRTSLHPEGLTSTCYEFKPKKRRKNDDQ